MYDIDLLKDRAIGVIEATRPALEDLALRIHDHPELCFQERYAAEHATALLEEWGFAVERGVAQLSTAFTATLTSGQTGPTIGLVAEYDAVPEVGHGCGHNLICAGMLGAARALAALSGEIEGTIKVYGTPAEEGGRGKAIMLEHEVFADLDAALQFHPGGRPGLAEHNLAAQNLKFVFAGKAADSTAAPWEGVDALDAANLFFMNTNALRGHVKPDVRLSGYISKGGDTIAIVTDKTEVHYRARSFDDEYLKTVVTRVEACASAAGTATGASVSIERGPFEPSILLNSVLADLVVDNGRRFGVDFSERERGSGSTDFAYLSRLVPSVMFWVPTWSDDIALHTVEAASAAAQGPALKGMLLGAQCSALTAIDLLSDPSHLRRAWAEMSPLVGERG